MIRLLRVLFIAALVASCTPTPVPVVITPTATSTLTVTPPPSATRLRSRTPTATETATITQAPSATQTPTATIKPTATPPATWTPGANTGWAQLHHGIIAGEFAFVLPPLEPLAGNWSMFLCKRYIENRTDEAQTIRLAGVTWWLEARQSLATVDFHADALWDGTNWLMHGVASGDVFLDLWCDFR